MSRVWRVREAEALLDQMLEASLREGPQVITRGGVETAVLVPIDRWRRLLHPARPSVKELLLADRPRTEALTPPRHPFRRRSTPRL